MKDKIVEQFICDYTASKSIDNTMDLEWTTAELIDVLEKFASHLYSAGEESAKDGNETPPKEGMDIYSPESTKVIYTGKHGRDSDKEFADEYLEIDKEYTIERTEVGGWHTDVYLKEVSGKSFNSVHFIKSSPQHPSDSAGEEVSDEDAEICKDCNNRFHVDNTVFHWDTGARRCFKCSVEYSNTRPTVSEEEITFEQCLREEFLISTQNYPKEYHNLFHKKFKRAESRFKELNR